MGYAEVGEEWEVSTNKADVASHKQADSVPTQSTDNFSVFSAAMMMMIIVIG